MRALLPLSIALLLAHLVLAEEWFMPDSHLINDTEFQDLVVGDKTAFKIVKYFSPHCTYCRYLKQVVDQLKHEKEWCFKIYDFNCAWYPHHCMNNVKSTSFPYTAIHNGNGDLHEEIHGFYPEPVIRAIFDRIELLCLEIKNPPKQAEIAPAAVNGLQAEEPVKQQQKIQVPVKSLQQHSQEAKVEQKAPQSIQIKPEEKTQTKVQVNEVKVEHSASKQPENKLDEAKIVLQEEQVKVDAAQKKEEKPSSGVTHQSSAEQGNIFKYLIYGVTICISVYYFHHINKGKQPHSDPHPHSHPLSHSPSHQSTPLLQNNNKISEQQSQVEQILRQQSQLLASIPDQEL